MNIVQLPLSSLTTQQGVKLRRERDLTTVETKELLSSAAVNFVIADVGSPLRWITEGDRFRFWKSEAQAYIADGGKKCLDDCPDGYFYFASEWRSDELGVVVVLLEKQH